MNRPSGDPPDEAPAALGPGPAAPLVAETHTSVVLFLGERAYKLRKPLDFGFIDLRSRAVRERVCAEEVRLNRRLAPDVYLGVAELRGPDGQPCDHAVVMRRLPAERRLAALLAAGADVTSELRAVARQVAEFHASAERSPRITEWGSAEAVSRLWVENVAGFREVGGKVVGDEETERIEGLAFRYIAGRARLFADRQARGLVVDGHGDLLADDIFCLPDGPRILDCLEFDARLRAGDVLADTAFLTMDLERLGHPEAATVFRRAYAEFSGEHHPASLEDFYVAYRAHVRAKVTALRAGQGDPGAGQVAAELSAQCLRHLELARVRLVLVGGLPGSGKTTLAEELSAHTGWTVLHSDVVRKEAHGIPATTPAAAAFGCGIYSRDASRGAYRLMLDRARACLQEGLSVVLDATWSSEAERGLARELASATSSDLVEVQCEVSEDIAASWLGARLAAGDSTSDADLSVRQRVAETFAPWAEAVRVDMSRGAGAAALAVWGWG